MKSRYLFGVFLCLFISCSSVFGVKDDINTDTTVQFLVQEFQTLRNRVSVLESVVEKQTETIQVQNDRIVKLEGIVKSRNFDEEDLGKPNSDAEDDADQSRDNNTKPIFSGSDPQDASMSFVRRKAPPEKDPKRSIQVTATQPVAFYAYMNGSIDNPAGHHPLIFDVAETNEGNGYHANLGVFIVPKSGTYFFSWTIRLLWSSHHSTELVVNNQAHGAIYFGTSNGQEDSVTGNLILRLNQQDEVFIRTGHDAYHGQLFSDYYGRTSFSGFLII